MKYHAIKYNISMLGWMGRFDIRVVNGYAVDMPLPIQVCVRKIGSLWVCDEYTTGFAITIPRVNGKTREEVAKKCFQFLQEKLKDGTFQPKLEAARKIVKKGLYELSR